MTKEAELCHDHTCPKIGSCARFLDNQRAGVHHSTFRKSGQCSNYVEDAKPRSVEPIKKEVKRVARK